jgi:hypothetical protein
LPVERVGLRVEGVPATALCRRVPALAGGTPPQAALVGDGDFGLPLATVDPNATRGAGLDTSVVHCKLASIGPVPHKYSNLSFNWGICPNETTAYNDFWSYEAGR